jgi:hypothetical protein
MNFKEAYKKAVEEGGTDELRKIACEDPYFAYLYARYIDKCSRDDTRKGACKNSERAYLYAKNIDKKYYKDTFEAVKCTVFEEKYKEELF